jgi:hypothetical protein
MSAYLSFPYNAVVVKIKAIYEFFGIDISNFLNTSVLKISFAKR